MWPSLGCGGEGGVWLNLPSFHPPSCPSQNFPVHFLAWKGRWLPCSGAGVCSPVASGWGSGGSRWTPQLSSLVSEKSRGSIAHAKWLSAQSRASRVPSQVWPALPGLGAGDRAWPCLLGLRWTFCGSVMASVQHRPWKVTGHPPVGIHAPLWTCSGQRGLGGPYVRSLEVEGMTPAVQPHTGSVTPQPVRAQQHSRAGAH